MQATIRAVNEYLLYPALFGGDGKADISGERDLQVIEGGGLAIRGWGVAIPQPPRALRRRARSLAISAQ
jgi:hypothetical protein